MSDLDDRIGDALRDLDGRVTHAVHTPRPVARRPLRFVVPVLAAAAVLAVLAGTLAIGRHQDKADSVIPSDTSSQTSGQAARDGVYPQIADLPWKQRIGKDKMGDSIMSSRTEPTVILKLVRPDLSQVTGFGADGCLPPVDAARSYPVCRNGEYTEFLLVEANTQRIVRAYPMPAKMTWMRSTHGQVYCGRDGKGRSPDSALCRIDLDTLELTGTVFQCDESEDACGPGDEALSRYPGHWFESPKIAGAASLSWDETQQDLAVHAADDRVTAHIDPLSLKVSVIPGQP